jgi:hypothetical protein
MVDARIEHEPKDRPILMSAPMIRRVIAEIEAAGSGKTQTRRPAWRLVEGGARMPTASTHIRPGDTLWVRESWRASVGFDALKPIDIPATTNLWWPADQAARITPPGRPGKLRPSIHMPRWATRILLAVKEVRTESLRAISEADAVAEGAMFHNGHGVGHTGWRYIDTDPVWGSSRQAFAALWERIHGRGSWVDQDVVVISFIPLLAKGGVIG